MRDGLSSTSKVDDAPATAPSRTIRPNTGPEVGALERHWGGEELAPTTLRAGGERVSDKHDREWCYREGNDR